MIVKDLTITVKYTVALSDVGMSEEVYNQLVDAYDEDCVSDLTEAGSWLADNIRECDAMEWKAEVDDIS